MGYATFVALVLAVLMPAESPADWPQFRGVNGSGVAEVGSLPITLQRGESRVWSVEVPFGRSSPSVFGDRVVVTGSVGDRLSAFAYSRSTGGELWRYDVVRSRPSERLDRFNNPASPTPAIDASGVYVFFPDVGLIGLSLDGKEKWRLPLGPFRTAYGMASSPIVSDGLVIQACDQQQDRSSWRSMHARAVCAGKWTGLICVRGGTPPQWCPSQATRTNACSWYPALPASKHLT